MYKGNKILVVIPARAHNDKIDQLNLKTLGGQPLISYTINAAQKSKYVDQVCVSTEDIQIVKLAEDLGVSVPFLRPLELTEIGVTAHQVAVNVLQNLDEKYDITIILWPNAPFRGEEIIDEAIQFKIEHQFKRIQGVRIVSDYFLLKEENKINPIKRLPKSNRPNLAELYTVAGGIFIYDTDCLLEGDQNLEFGNFVIHEHKARLIHSLYDLLIAERLIKLHESLVDSLINAT